MGPTPSGMVLETFGLLQTKYVTKGKSLGGGAPCGMVLKTFGLPQTRYVTEGKSVRGEVLLVWYWKYLSCKKQDM